MTNSYQHIYLSPHYDDVALSCGGTVHQQGQAGESVQVITIFAAPPNPDNPLSPFAQELHQNWGSPEDVVSTRRAEDEAAMGILGVDSVRLDFADCIYRGRSQKGEWYYTTNADLFGQIHPAEQSLIKKIAAAIQKLFSGNTPPTLYAPLTVGHHVDHQLVHAVARQLAQQGHPTIYYEDYPYVDPGYIPHGQDEQYDDLQATLTRVQALDLHPRIKLLSAEDLEAKIKSIAAYGSQLQVLFGGREAMVQKVTSYTRQVGQRSSAERVWSPS